MNEKFLKEIVVDQLKKEIPAFKVGDELSVSIRIQEGEKERLQKFVGIVIARKGSGISETFTVRRATDGVGVERVFPLHSPSIANLKVVKESVVSDKAKMYYMRKRSGKAANQVREKRFFEKN
ncbi:MAG: 50S ribosomal protein L19 [Opitutales bacterium]|nr:50S ribosomal protein L19 [Opitutales bacterium]